MGDKGEAKDKIILIKILRGRAYHNKWDLEKKVYSRRGERLTYVSGCGLEKMFQLDFVYHTGYHPAGFGIISKGIQPFLLWQTEIMSYVLGILP